MCRTVTKNMKNFPAALLYTPRRLGGLGIPQFSVTVQHTKTGMLMAGLAEGGRQKDTAESLLSRVGRVIIVDFSNEWQNYIDTLPGTEHRCWAASLLTHLMDAGFYVMRHGEPMPAQDEPVHRSLQLTVNKYFYLPPTPSLWGRH